MIAGDDATLFVGADLMDELALRLEEIGSARRKTPITGSQPPLVLASAELLEAAFGRLEITSGPTYLIHRGASFEAVASICRSNDEEARTLIDRSPPEANWAPDEWRDLVEGRLGPWAMALDAGSVVSICHSARLASQGAEAGTWTHPEHRGRGHAAAATAAWAALLADSGKYLFYSTSADNRSSQQVAARLGLREIGWTWRIGPAV